MKTFIVNSTIATVFLLFSSAFAGADSTKVFTQEEFNLIVNYMQRGSIPALADSATMASVQTLKAKLDGVLTKKKALASFSLTREESNVINYLMRSDIESALTLLRLQQKLAPAANGQANKKK